MYPPHILCVSRDPLLLKTRHAVLSKRYATTAVLGLGEMNLLAPDASFDAVVLCHTLTKVECERLVGLARQRWPAAKILALTSDSRSCAEQRIDKDINCLDGPVMMLQAIQDLLRFSEHTRFSASI